LNAPGIKRYPCSRAACRAFTLIELMITVALAAVLATIAFSSYSRYIARARVTAATADIAGMQVSLERYFTDHNILPATLAAAGVQLTDPWGRPYQYLPIAGARVGQVRKDRSLHPINTDYDLYSLGADGRSASALTANVSQDDVIRATNGAFIGLASDY